MKNQCYFSVSEGRNWDPKSIKNRSENGIENVDFSLVFQCFFGFRGFRYKCRLWMDSGANLAPFWCGLGSQNSSWERLGASWRRLGGMLGRLGSVLELLGGVLGVSWGVLGASWAVLEASWARLGSILEASWKRLGKILKIIDFSMVFQAFLPPR